MKNKKICKFCKKKYKKEAQTLTLFGSTFCLHDEKLTDYRKLSSISMPSAPAAEVTRSGRNSAEQKYIEKNEREGNVVVRGGDGTLHALGDKNKPSRAPSPFARKGSRRGS